VGRESCGIVSRKAESGRLKVAGWRQEWRKTHGWGAGSLVGDNLDALDVASRLEDLAQDVFRDTGVESTNVQGALVWLRGGATRGIARTSTSAGGRHDTTRHGGADGGGDGVGVLGDDDGGERRGRHVLLGVALLAVVARRTGRRRWGRQVAARRCRVGHG
jgi:hypothetical protein